MEAYKMGCNCGCKNCGSVTGLAHIGVIVSDISGSIEFYSELLDFDCYSKAEVGPGGETKLAFLRCGACEIELVMPPESQQRKDGPVDHIALKVNDIDAMMSRLKSKGIKFETEESQHLPALFENGVKCVFFHGPDGERIELSEEL